MEAAARLTESREYQNAYGRLTRAITGGTRLLTGEEMEAIGGLVRTVLASVPTPALRGGVVRP